MFLTLLLLRIPLLSLVNKKRHISFFHLNASFLLFVFSLCIHVSLIYSYLFVFLLFTYLLRSFILFFLFSITYFLSHHSVKSVPLLCPLFRFSRVSFFISRSSSPYSFLFYFLYLIFFYLTTSSSQFCLIRHHAASIQGEY